MGKYEDAFKKAGWQVVESAASTTFTSAIPEDLQNAMAAANKDTGYLSSGIMKFGFVKMVNAEEITNKIFVGSSPAKKTKVKKKIPLLSLHKVVADPKTRFDAKGNRYVFVGDAISARKHKKKIPLLSLHKAQK